jgi:hypothetical protein
MSAHTPGPWAVEDPIFQQLTIVEADKQTYEWRFIASVDLVPYAEDDRPISVGEATANARLISAAPDLLAALQAVDLARHTDAGDDWQRATDLTDAAIAKATGA